MLRNRLAREGHLLFQHRGILPLCLILPLLWSYQHFQFLAGDAALEQWWLSGCVAVALSGLAIRVTTVAFVPAGTSGRNTAEQIATELNTTGWYSVSRNPLYLGNYLIGLGIALAPHDLLMVVSYTAIFWLYYERIIAAEEGFLEDKFGAAFRRWSSVTPIFLPSFSLWQRPTLTFCWRTAVRREYSAILLIGVMFSLVDVMAHVLAERRILLDPSFALLLGGTALMFVASRSLKKHTQVLDVAGRS